MNYPEDCQEEYAWGESVKDIFKAAANKTIVRYAVAGTGIWVFFLIGIFLISYLAIISLLASFSTQPGHLAGKPTTTATQEIGEDFHIFQQAQEKYGVSWAILAAIAKTESSFGRGKYYLERGGISPAGAVGYMQFMPTTWSGANNPKANNSPTNPVWDEDPENIARYGGYGTDGDFDGIADPYNPWDAVAAAAKMLKANNVDANPEEAIYLYNHDWGYVNQILAEALNYSIYQIPQMTGIWPLPPEFNQITATFGQTTAKSGKVLWPSGHTGVDIACPEGTPLFAVVSGKVVFAGGSANGGNYVKIQTDEGTAVAYAHLSKINVKSMDYVEQGTVIGLSGNTGRSTGPHLHFELYVDNRLSDPLMWLIPPSENY
jgi:murein DD-endopeptidase MepM/ murein hydrolase activator NlpD